MQQVNATSTVCRMRSLITQGQAKLLLQRVHAKYMQVAVLQQASELLLLPSRSLRQASHTYQHVVVNIRCRAHGGGACRIHADTARAEDLR